MSNNHRMAAYSMTGATSPEGRELNVNEFIVIPEFENTTSFSNEIPDWLLLDNASALSPTPQDGQMSIGRSTTQEEPPHRRHSVHSEHTSLSSAQGPPEDTTESVTVSFLGSSDGETGAGLQKSATKPLTWKEKLGTIAIVGLIAGSVLLCVAVGTLMFIWFGSPSISAWKELTARNWLSKAVSICIGVIQQVMVFQLGIVTAMIAALALESSDVAISDVASVSTMRATAAGTGAFVMAWQYLSRGLTYCVQHSQTLVLVFCAALLWCVSQFLLLILLTGVSLRSTAGLASTVALPYNLHYNVTNSTNILSSRFIEPPAGAWLRRAPRYTQFAEYSETPYEAPGVSDTGVTLRAFLPFSTTRDRENLESYKGNATVLDARVSCQVPEFSKASVNGEGLFQGLVSASRYTPRLGNATRRVSESYENYTNPTFLVHRNESVDFNCLAPVWNDTTNRDWKISFCQLREDGGQMSGGLVSEFRDLSNWMKNSKDSTVFGTAYLMLNVTMGTAQDWASAFETKRFSDGPRYVAEAYQERGEWLDLIYSKGSIILSVSLCYAAFDFADIEVRMSSQSNRTESRLDPSFDQNSSVYTFEGLRTAMGQDRGLSLEKRGVLKLEQQSWLAAPQENFAAGRVEGGTDTIESSEWYLRSTADLVFHDKNDPSQGNAGNVVGILCSLEPRSRCNYPSWPCVAPEQMHIWLFQEILKTGGTIAFALQTMITMLSSMAYYEQMGQFDKWTQAEISYYQPAEVPVGYAGLAVVLAAVTVHGILVSYCVALFLQKTSLTRLGANWSTIAQVATGDVGGLLKDATTASDDDVQKRLKTEGAALSKVRLEETDEKASISVIGKCKDIE